MNLIFYNNWNDNFEIIINKKRVPDSNIINILSAINERGSFKPVGYNEVLQTINPLNKPKWLINLLEVQEPRRSQRQKLDQTWESY